MSFYKYCSKEINNKGSLAAHEKQCINNPNRVPVKRSPKAGAKKGCVPHNKGSSISEEQKIKISKSLKGNPLVTGKASSAQAEAERILKITNYAKLHNGGYRYGSGRGKKGWYKGIYCDSSWELAFVVYHLDNGIPIERCPDKRIYVFENQTRNYYPDFVVNSQIFEIKGYKTEQSKAKQLFNPDIILIDKESIKPYLDYTINKYTKDFITLYEKV